MGPGLLLLDEPTANLDPVGVDEVRQAVARTLDCTGATFVVVEHRVDVWIDLVTRVVVLGRDGRLIADGEPGHVITTQRDALLAAGVWVPGVRPAVSAARPAPAASVVDLEGIDLAIGRRSDAVVRDGLALALPRAASTVLTGPNGAGKSTLALTMGGLLAPLAGRVHASTELAGGLKRDPIRWRSRELLSRIGTVFQEPEHQFVASTVQRELEVAPHALGLDAATTARRTREVLERLGLDRLAQANPFTLSGGEQRRLTVGCALVAQPRVVILDEPTFGQDRLTWIELVTLLRALVDDGTTLLSVSHDAAYLDALGDQHLDLGSDALRMRAAA
jgi:energy-coupling factor transport system ATP-binding protein